MKENEKIFTIKVVKRKFFEKKKLSLSKDLLCNEKELIGFRACVQIVLFPLFQT